MVAGLVAVLAYQWTPDTWVQTVAYDTVGFASVAAMATGILVNRPARALPWWLLLAGQFCFVSGDMVAAVMRRWLGLEPFPAPADYIYLVGYALQIVALLIIIRRRPRGGDGAALLEASIIGAAFALVSWVFLMKPVVLDTELTLAGKLISVGYPALDLLLLALLVRLLAGSGTRSPAFWWLATSIALTLGADYAWAFTDRMAYDGGTVFSHLLDGVFLLSFLSCGVAALHPSMRRITDNDATAAAQRLGPAKLVLLTAATLIGPLVLAWQAGRHDGRVDAAVAITIGCIGMFLLVIARMTLLLKQVQVQSDLLEKQAVVLRELAQHDALTGLPNRRAWDAALSTVVTRGARDGSSFCVAILDLDYFKRYNDSFGHPAGDRLLKTAAATWAARLRRSDLLARYGGEEFVVLLPDTTEAQAVALLDELRAATPENQTFSAGVAVWDGIEPEQALLERADRALYTAKEAGRNRVACAPDAVRA
jgi:diguanylate cyclase (GGDEF)-like protein